MEIHTAQNIYLQFIIMYNYSFIELPLYEISLYFN